jgi:hypothetical protein
VTIETSGFMAAATTRHSSVHRLLPPDRETGRSAPVPGARIEVLREALPKEVADPLAVAKLSELLASSRKRNLCGDVQGRVLANPPRRAASIPVETSPVSCHLRLVRTPKRTSSREAEARSSSAASHLRCCPQRVPQIVKSARVSVSGTTMSPGGP